MPGLTITFNATVRNWVEQQKAGGAAALVTTHNLQQALSDGQATLDEVDMPLDTFRQLSGGGPAITRQTLQLVVDRSVDDTVVNAFRSQFRSIERGVRTRVGSVDKSDLAVTGIDVAVGRGQMTLNSVTEIDGYGQPWQRAYTITGDGLYAALFNQVAANDADGDRRIHVFGEMGPATGLKQGTSTFVSTANPVRTSKDLLALAGGKDHFTADDYVNFLIVRELQATGVMAAPTAL